MRRFFTNRYKKTNRLRLVAGKPNFLGVLALKSAVTNSPNVLPFGYPVNSDIKIFPMLSDGTIENDAIYEIKKGEQDITSSSNMFFLSSWKGLVCMPEQDDKFIYEVEIKFL